MAFLHRIGLKTASLQFRRCYTHLLHASFSNSIPKPKTLPTVMPYSHSLFHNTRPINVSPIVLNSVRCYVAPVQFQPKPKNEDHDTDEPRMNDQIKDEYVKPVEDDAMTSEIEVVEEVQYGDQQSIPSSFAGGVAEDRLQKDVYIATAYGDLEKLRRLVEQEGCLVTEPDAMGYYPLQWAALNNHTAIAQYIIDHGGDINATDRSGQTALHWSAVRGSVEVAELLLKKGAQLNSADKYGYQTTHVAAQYGHTSFLYNLVSKWNVEPDVPDNEGRTPLHWAAYKGFSDLIRLLLFLDANRGRIDKEGCTPLHWAAIKGNLQACILLVHAGKNKDLMVTDNTGLTPVQLASYKNHREIVFFLENYRRRLEKRLDSNSPLGKIYKLFINVISTPIISISKHRFNTSFSLDISFSIRSLTYYIYHITFFISTSLKVSNIIWMYNEYFPKLLGLWSLTFVLLVTYTHCVILAKNIPKLTSAACLFAWFGVLLATVGLVMSCRCSTKDPGYIGMNGHDTQSQNIKDNEPFLQYKINNPALLAGNWSQICATCKIIRPLRTKHCVICDQCVEQFDHHCPWLSSCIGKKNKRDFFAFLVLETSAMLVTGVVCLKRLAHSRRPSSFGSWIKFVGSIFFLIADLFLFWPALDLTVMQASNISSNLTTNEMINHERYSYLKGPDGSFRNPYDHGIKKNCSDFLINGYNEDIEYVEETNGDSCSHNAKGN